LVRKRLIPFALADNAEPLQSGGIVTFAGTNGESHECGEIKSIIASPDGSKPNIAMVMVRVEYVHKSGQFFTGASIISARIPSWMRLPEIENAESV
jgi:hypothetical protein